MLLHRAVATAKSWLELFAAPRSVLSHCQHTEPVCNVLLGRRMETKLNVSREGLILLGMERTAACCGSLLSAPTSNVRISRLLVSFGVSHQRSFVQIFPFLFCRVDIGKSIHLCQPKSSAALLTATATRVPPLVGTPIRTSL